MRIRDQGSILCVTHLLAHQFPLAVLARQSSRRELKSGWLAVQFYSISVQYTGIIIWTFARLISM